MIPREQLALLTTQFQPLVVTSLMTVAELKHLSKKTNSLLERSIQSLSVHNKLIHSGVLAAVHMPLTCEKRLKRQTLVI